MREEKREIEKERVGGIDRETVRQTVREEEEEEEREKKRQRE